MLRLASESKIRLYSITLVSMIALTVMIWPMASMWTSYGQTQEGGPKSGAAESQPGINTPGEKRDILDKMLSPDPGTKSSDGSLLPSQI